MRIFQLIAPLPIILLFCLSAIADEPKIPPGAQPIHRKAISLEQQNALLSSPASNPLGTFDSFCSFLYAVRDVCIHTHSNSVNRTQLAPVFPKFYKPNFRQLFETIARQTHSTMHYDKDTDYWVFDPPAMPLPYSLEVAQGWKVEDNGLFVKYVPPLQPVGMDVYMLGTYSPPDDQSLANKVRDALALHFASTFDPTITPDKMTVENVAGTQALYFECPARKPGVTWRQWSMVHNGQAIVVVSSLDKANEAILVPQVKQMVASLKINGACASR
jgi:hypothetical protein